MRFSKMYVKTLKETPKDAEVISHQLMLRAGMIKKLASGVYSYLPLGYRVLKNVEKIVREEMDRAGAQEILMPVIQPAELWQESGRWNTMGAEMMRIKDRHDRDFVLGPTHEEVITDIIRNDISSYKALPLNLYQIQTKFRDERRPRFGLMRGREFLMKDAYSFHATGESLDEEFENMKDAYNRIFSRCGLGFRSVEADSGAIGGNGSQEFHVLAESGEDDIYFCNKCNYAANVEKAVSNIDLSEQNDEEKNIELVDTPNVSKIEDVVKYLNLPIEKTVKAMMFTNIDTEDVYMVLIRGDFEVNDTKVKNLFGATDVELLNDAGLEELGLIKGFIGPYGIDTKEKKITVIADESIVKIKNHSLGGNKLDTHFMNANYGRDYTADIVADVRNVKAGDTCPHCNGTLEVARGIEVGHVFKLGSKYSESLNATYLDQNGKTQTMIMGCYGIGVSRTAAAAIEQNYDQNGIIWPVSIAPYIVDVIPANMKDSLQVEVATKLYEELKENLVSVALDDRSERAGFKFKDADLIGFPLKVVAGKGVKDGNLEIKVRRTSETFEVKIEDALEFVMNWIKENK